ncbi:NADP-dependent oxidoreductase [Roseateles sp.]|uniref:NADP-dependent oxidoreductase n=1 Tax=Roseateles sp. TaxID=1971397 RepID=UPI003BA517DB
MKALTLTQYQKVGFDAVRLQDLPSPKPLPSQVRVRMRAAALNPADLHIISGEMKGMSPVKPPFAVGVDGAGVVEAVGREVHNVKVGDEVFFYTGLVHCGTVAEYAVVEAAWVAKKPAAWSFEQAAAAALALLCANLSLQRARVKSGQRVLIHGGGGAVGAAAIVLARAMGAQVDTTANSADAHYLKALGAQDVFDYRTQPLSTLSPACYDMVLDGMGGETFLNSIPLIKTGGVIASLKVMTGVDDMLRQGMKPPFIVKWVLPLIFGKYIKAAKNAGVRLEGVATFGDGATLTAMGERAVLLGYQPRIAQTFALSQAKQALDSFAQSKPRGKVVVLMD